MEKGQLREIVRNNLDEAVAELNNYLQGKNLEAAKPILERVGRGGRIPHWFEGLLKAGTLPNLDGKTIGSVLEMLFVAVLENNTFKELEMPPLKINPARGVDIPDLDMGIKTPSENYCTSEPFFSAYERLIGNEHDALIMLTNYQTAKKNPPLRLRVIKHRYLYGSELADYTICGIARKIRAWLIELNTAWAQKVFRFLAYVNQSDWRAKRLLRLVGEIQSDAHITESLSTIGQEFKNENEKKEREGKEIIPDDDLLALLDISKIQPLHLGVITAADDWVTGVLKDAGRLPNDNEWTRLQSSPLDGQIGMSFALQWRYNFSGIFGSRQEECNNNNHQSCINVPGGESML